MFPFKLKSRKIKPKCAPKTTWNLEKCKPPKQTCQRRHPPLAGLPMQEHRGQGLRPSLNTPQAVRKGTSCPWQGATLAGELTPGRTQRPVPAGGRVESSQKGSRPLLRSLNRGLAQQVANPPLNVFPTPSTGPGQHFHSEVKVDGLLDITQVGKDKVVWSTRWLPHTQISMSQRVLCFETSLSELKGRVDFAQLLVGSYVELWIPTRIHTDPRLRMGAPRERKREVRSHECPLYLPAPDAVSS